MATLSRSVVCAIMKTRTVTGRKESKRLQILRTASLYWYFVVDILPPWVQLLLDSSAGRDSSARKSTVDGVYS